MADVSHSGENSDGPLLAKLEPLPSLEVIGTRWQRLEQATQGTFFSSWTWMSSWLAQTQEDVRLFSLQAAQGQDVALGFLSPIGATEGFSLNAPASEEERLIFLEYGELLCRPDDSERAIASLLKEIESRDLKLSGSTQPYDHYEAATARLAVRRHTRPAPFVDLEKVRRADQGYWSLLSRNTRQQLARAERLICGDSALTLSAAPTVEDALALVAQMETLSIERFLGTNNASSFSSEFFQSFVRNLVRDGHPKGEVDVLGIYCGETCLGVLFNFNYGGIISNYQSGFAAHDDGRAKIGHLCHSLAVRYYAEHGAERYSFLAGDDQYKMSLSTDVERLYWSTLKVPTLRDQIEHSARKLFGRLET